MNKKQNEIAELLKQREFSANQEPPAEEVVFRIQFQTIGSLGDYALLTGRPKAGKTKYISGAMAAGISGMEVFGMQIKLPEGKKRVVHFDTEQGRRSHYNVLHLAQRLIEAETMPTHFKSFHCRQDAPHMIIAMIDYYIAQNPDTGLLILDGLLDLIESFNDEKASKALVNWLKRITEANNTFILGVLHRSMSADKSIGHLGSSADRAAQSVLIVEKNKETKQYLLKAEYLRDGDDFTPIAIIYNNQMNIWQQTDYIPDGEEQQPTKAKNMKRRPGEYEISEHVALSTRIFLSEKVHDYKNLLQRIQEVYAVGRQWAVDCVPELERLQLIFRIDNGFTNIRQGKLKMVD